MDFARKQLEKYGWSEGKGLGKHENGISTALKPKLKFDNAGVGHNVGEQFTNNWWEKLFNSAAENIDVEVGANNQVKMRLKSKDAVEITTKNYSIKQIKNKYLDYGSFLKTAKLTENGIESYNCPSIVEEEPMSSFQALTDNELFAACGGRTAHKGARHGLKLSGKLSRIEKQEKMLLKKMKKVSLSDDIKEKSLNEKKLKKIKKQKDTHREKYTPIVEDSMESITSNGLKKKKKRKSVSFNETVTKIYTVDLDTSFESEYSSTKDENSNEPILENIASGSDEGKTGDLVKQFQLAETFLVQTVEKGTTIQRFDDLRYSVYFKKVCNVCELPPTSDSIRLHILRAYCTTNNQRQILSSLYKKLDPFFFGYSMSLDGKLTPTRSNRIYPSMKELTPSCRCDKCSTKACGCVRNGLACCKCCKCQVKGTCKNTPSIISEDRTLNYV